MKKKLGILFFLVTLISYAFNFSVAPTRFEVSIDKVNTNEITLINNTTSPMRLESFLEVAPGYEKYSLNNNIKLYPKIIAIKPGGKQIVRFRIKPEVGMTNGEYKSYIVFKEIPLKNKIEEDAGTFGAQIKMITEVGISIYGYYGEIHKQIEVSNLKVDFNLKTSNLRVSLDSISKGNSSELLKQKIEILNTAGLVVKTVDSQLGRTERNGKLKIENIMKVSDVKGEKIRVTIYNSEEKVLAKKTIKI